MKFLAISTNLAGYANAMSAPTVCGSRSSPSGPASSVTSDYSSHFETAS